MLSSESNSIVLKLCGLRGSIRVFRIDLRLVTGFWDEQNDDNEVSISSISDTGEDRAGLSDAEEVS